MAQLTFLTGETKTGRAYLAVKELCQIATFEKDYNSVQFLVKDKLTGKGLRIVASRAMTSDIVISMSKAKGILQPEGWTLQAYSLNNKNENESVTLNVGETLDNIVIEEV